MKTRKLGRSRLVSSSLAYGCMRIAGTWDPAKFSPQMEKAGIAAVNAAWDAGYTLFDHADIYGRGLSEQVWAKAAGQNSALRKKALIATKCGIRWQGDSGPDAPHRYDFSAKHILWSCDQSLKRLGVDTIHLYQLHRPDLLADPDEIAGAFVKLKKQGKVREFGASNFSPSLLSAVQSACPMPLIVNQVEIHLARLDCLSDGTLDQCLSGKITPLAWSPLAGGWLGAGGQPNPNDPNHKRWLNLCKVADQMAAAYGVSRTVISLAWLLKHPSGIIPIIGTINPQRIRDSVGADSVELSREDWYKLTLAARGSALP